MNLGDAEEYTQALGQVVAGGYRQVALGKRLGVPEALGLSVEEWVETRLGGYVRMSIPDRREAVGELTEEGLSTREIGEVLGVDHSTVVRDIGANAPTESAASPLIVRQIDASGADAPLELKLTPLEERKRDAALETQLARNVSRSAPVLSDAFDLRFGDAREVLVDIPDSSVQLVLTDPPYGDEAEPLYEWLAEWAERVLIPGGSLIVYTGQSRLDRDMRIFGDRLRYWWLLSMLHTQSQRLPGKFVLAEFKPVLWFVKHHRRGRTLVNDVLRPPQRDKSEHKWGQGEGGVTFLIEHLTAPGEMVVDPFAGTATWGRIAESMGRRWIGAEVEADSAVRATGVIAA